jgi:hypothetical protein
MVRVSVSATAPAISSSGRPRRQAESDPSICPRCRGFRRVTLPLRRTAESARAHLPDGRYFPCACFDLNYVFG